MPLAALLLIRLTFQASAPPTVEAEVLQMRGKPDSQLPGLCEMEGGEGSACKEDACRTD